MEHKMEEHKDMGSQEDSMEDSQVEGSQEEVSIFKIYLEALGDSEALANQEDLEDNKKEEEGQVDKELILSVLEEDQE
jgi:hypothetical protein